MDAIIDSAQNIKLKAAEVRIEHLSKGMQQKVQFIATVIHEPRLLMIFLELR